LKNIDQNFAAIDIGTNSIHLVVVKITEEGSFETIDQVKEVVRLGEDSENDIKHLTDAAIKRGINALKTFKGIAQSHNAKIRAVATSAVREASNKNDFLKKVKEQTGIDTEIISGHEEARLIYLGALRTLPIYDKTIMLIDIGGGSTEFLVAKEGVVLYSNSLKIGAVRLTNKFFPEGRITKSAINDTQTYAEGMIYPVFRDLQKFEIEKVVGTSGTIMACGNMIAAQKGEVKSSPTILNNFEFSNNQLRSIKKNVLNFKTTNERKSLPGLDSKRADIIPAGVILLSSIFEMLEIQSLVISGFALREGIVIDSIQKLNPNLIDSKVKNVRKESVLSLAANCRYDQKHCEHVSRLALKIFDQLKFFHNLDENCREYLEAAALLHDIGYHIAHSKHHRHSQYIIQNSELLGFNENEIQIIANVARYHRKSHPKSRHPQYEDLDQHSKSIVNKLSAILRLADSLDRTHQGIVSNIELKVYDNKVDLILHGLKELPEIETWSFNRRKSLFEETFNTKVKLIANN